MKKAAIVTGGAKRIGRAIAVMLANKGYDIVLHYNSSLSDAEIVADEIAKTGRECKLLTCDFNHSDQVVSVEHPSGEISRVG